MLKRLFQLFLLTLLLPIVVWLAIIALDIALPLTPLNKPLSAALSRLLMREVSFDGDIMLVPTLRPTLQINHVSIGNPAGKNGGLLELGRVQLQLDLVSMLSLDFEVDQFLAQDVQLNLQEYADGSANWMFKKPAGKTAAKPKFDPLAIIDQWDFRTDLRDIQLHDLTITYHDFLREEGLVFVLKDLRGQILWRSDMTLKGTGHYQNQLYDFSLRADPLRELLHDPVGWKAASDINIAGLALQHKTELLEKGRSTSIQVDGQSLQSLSRLTGLALPAWGPYQLAGAYSLTDKAYELERLTLRLGDSDLKGQLSLTWRDGEPVVKLGLHSGRLQLNDFTLPDAEQKSEDTGGTAAPEQEEAAPWSLDDTILSGYSLDLDLAVDEVLSGADTLGAGTMLLQAGRGKAVLEQLHIELPGGAIETSASLAIVEQGYQVALKMDADNFDYGVLARRIEPDTDLKGNIFLDIDLQSTTPSLEQAFAFGNGHVGLAIWPQSFKSGVFDLWAVGLLAAAFSNVEDSKSVINCAVARFELDKGIMREQSILIDTTRMRVLGQGEINFIDESVEILLAPKSKKPQLISAATPVTISGSFAEFEPDVAGGDIAYSVLRSAFNVWALGIPLLFHQTINDDPSEVCQLAMVEDMRLERKGKKKRR